MKKLKRVLSLVLCIAVIVVGFNVLPEKVCASTTPGTVTQAQVEAKLTDVVNKLKGKYFNKNNITAPCLYAPGESGHGCDKCNSINILGSGSSWFRSLFGINTTSYYGTYNTYTGSMVRGYSCVGFANLIGWYLFQTNETDVINYNLLKKGSFNREAFIDARPGDIVALCDSNGNHIHSMIFLSSSDSGIEVLDCNWSRQTYGNCYIQVHNFNFSSYSGYKVAINRASNYAVDSTSGNVTFTHTASACQAQHSDIFYETSSSANAVNNMNSVAQHFNGWYRNCFDYVGIPALGYYEYLTWYIRKIAYNAGVSKIFSQSDSMPVFYKEMIEKYGASGYYIPSNCVQGYDASPFANATPITWTQKDIRPGDVIFVWDNAADGTKTNFEHCYLVQRVENDVAYVTDGGVIDASGAVKARYDKTYSSLSSEGTWISKHLIGYVRPNYSELDKVECKHESTVLKNSIKETCGKNGYTGDTYCSTCGVLIKNGTTVQATGAHKWNNGVITKEATDKEKGIILYTCTVCGATKTEEYAAKPKTDGMRLIDGRKFWYENNVRQGTYEDPSGVKGDGTVRGREIYDPDSDGWYWLDACYAGAVAVSKEVWMPYIYQNENDWGDGEIAMNAANSGDMALQVIKAINNKEGKWVRYDASGKMYKGWYTVEGEDALLYPSQAGNTYYYDKKTGLMARGTVTIDGVTYNFDQITGALIK